MNKAIITIIVTTLLLLGGCAYYNTFFNAKKSFKEAEDERKKSTDEQISSATRQKYEQAIKKASKLLEFYPKSKYVDDALFLLGKSFYYQTEYRKAKRKFEELIQNYPQSEFVPEARLWLGKTHTELRDYETAERNFQSIMIQKADREIIDEAQFLLGNLHFHKDDYIRAVGEYEIAAKNAKDKSMRSQAYYQVGACYLELKDYAAAATAFEKAKKYSTTPETEFEAQFKSGLANKELKQYDKAIDIFTDLLGDFNNEDNWPLCKLEIAHCLYQKDDVSNAIEWYESITQDENKRTTQAKDASAKAYYQLGYIYQIDKSDYEQAKEYYDLSVKENSRSEVAEAAKASSKNIQNLLALKKDIQEQQRRIAAGDSVAAVMDSLEVDSVLVALDDPQDFLDSTLVDSILQDSLLQDSLGYGQNRDDLFPGDDIQNPRNEENKRSQKFVLKTGKLGTPEEELIKDKLMLAEIYLFEFNQPDSALFEYLDVLERDTTDKILSKAIYSIGYIFENIKKDTVAADSIYRELLAAYPNTEYAAKARKQLGIKPQKSLDEQLLELFQDAEKQYLDNQNYNLALSKFTQIAENNPESSFATKSLFAIGWIYDNNLHNNNKAMETYQRIVDEYPDTDYAKRVKKKLDAVEKAKSEADEDKKQQETVETEEQVSAELTEITEQAEEVEKVDVSQLDKDAYYEYLRKEILKNNPRLKYPNRIIK